MNEIEVAALFLAWQDIIKLMPKRISDDMSFTTTENDTVTISVGDVANTVKSLDAGIIVLHQLVLSWIVAFTEAARRLACLKGVGEDDES